MSMSSLIPANIDIHPPCEIAVKQQSRDEWLQERRKSIGASDASAILGINPWSTPWEIWAEKRGMLAPMRNAATDAGNALEPVVLNYAEHQLGKLDRNVRVKHDLLPLAATCDAIVASCGTPVEAKTTGIVGPVVGDWGDESTDQVPDYYLVQVHAQLMCTKKDIGYLFALLPGRGFVSYVIEANPRLHQHLGEILGEWWDRHIVQGIEPSLDVMPSLEVVRRLKKTAGKSIQATENLESLIETREMIKAQAKALSEHLEKIESELLIELGDAECATLKDGRSLTYLESSRKGYTVEPCTFRQLRIKKGK